MNNLNNTQLLELSIALAQSVATDHRYDDLLTAIRKMITCDAIVLLAYKGDYLQPLAQQGLAKETIGRRFHIDQHPRFEAICNADQAVRFPADSDMPDPYDGLLTAMEGDLPVHACMGIPLYFSEQLIGVLTLDSLTPAVFDQLSSRSLALIASMASISLHSSLTMESLQENVNHAKAVMKALNEPNLSGSFMEIIGQSSAIKKLKHDISLVAPSNYSVLIEGESGTGKELVAHSIHQQSDRYEQAMIYVNCAALPENLVESELFGHVKGAFTGAESKRAGKFLIADGGTLFLDEVGELPLSTQSKLLRALQSNEIQPVGQDNIIRVNVRVIAATNRDLKEEVNKGRFRADLYHRLNVYPIAVPPLREREGDINLLTGFFIERASRKLGVNQLKVSPALSENLASYNWPGNVRELEHFLTRAALKACAKVPMQQRHDHIVTIDLKDGDDLSLLPATETATANAHEISANTEPYLPQSQTPLDLRNAMNEYQRKLVKQALVVHEGNWSKAARHLNVDRANLVRLAKRLGITIEKNIL
ncbi:nitric oxide reductase transcriptional regulator NorR [Thalassotalea agarivorans]|uniref:Anaerobic nitric oxide reductase transcription regulator n=1 Tax=Thalassotalea agarivorans TaxID=349064 RepID=A0A1I0HC55_THASX|nr:nitric oxide reductase transcriptional regulator NorR [Thalassotalea agarivorans]SET80527.1 anaerobic nitric oxide reductase transcription regulator [Thalassotalea agarivorans]